MDESTGEVKMNLREKLLAVMGSVGNVPKEGKNTQGQGYNYQRAADIFPKVQNALVSIGIVFMAHEVACDFPPSHETKNGATMFVATVKMRYTFHDIGSDETLVGEGSGLGFDTSDKALNKAKTAALKYFLKQTLLIGEDDDDSEKDTHETRFNRAQPPRVAPRTTGPTPPTEYVPRIAIENLVRAAARKMKSEETAFFELARWGKELGCTRDTTTQKQLGELTLRVAEWEPPAEQREPGDESQIMEENLEAGFRASIDGDENLSQDLDAALGTVNQTMNRVGQQNHNGENITEEESRRLFGFAKGHKEILKEVRESFGFKYDRDIPKSRYSAVIDAIKEMVRERGIS